MGYSGAGGPKGLGVFNNTPQTVADLNQLVALIAERGNTREGTTAERDALTGADLYDGLMFTDTGTGMIYVRIAGAWLHVGGGNRMTNQATNTFVTAAMPLIYTGIAQGTTTPGGVLIHTFPVAFPVACFAVLLAPDTLSNFDAPSGAFPHLVSGTVNRFGFQSFWGGRSSANVGSAYVALGI